MRNKGCRAVDGDAVSGGGCNGIHLRVNADALVIAVTTTEGFTVVATVANSTVATVAKTLRSTVVAGGQDPISCAYQYGAYSQSLTFGARRDADCLS